MDNLSNFFINKLFAFAYPIGFIGAIMFSVQSFVSVDFLTIIFNKNMIVAINIYIAICGYIAFCTFFKIQTEVGGYVIDFDYVYVTYDEFNSPNQTQRLITPSQTPKLITPSQTLKLFTPSQT